jgi:hypothetical protein
MIIHGYNVHEFNSALEEINKNAPKNIQKSKFLKFG